MAGTPALHEGCVHSLASSGGTSPLSEALVTSPIPSHCSCWQSPCIWSSLGSGLPTVSGVTTQLPEMHAMGAQKVPPVQSVSAKQLWQFPLSSHICEPAGPHVPPAFTGGLLGTPAMHTSPVQSLPSTGRSVLSALDCVPPELPHVSSWQSPATWLPEGMAVPTGATTTAHAFVTHTNCTQAVSVPQCEPVLQPTQLPLPSQYEPPEAQGVSISAGGNMGAPSTHACVVHSSPSSWGRSVSSTMGARPPSPSQISAWQSPGSWSSVGATLPSVANVRPNTPLVHVLAAQKVSSPHSSGVLQPTHCPLASQLSVPSPHSLPMPRMV